MLLSTLINQHARYRLVKKYRPTYIPRASTWSATIRRSRSRVSVDDNCRTRGTHLRGECITFHIGGSSCPHLPLARFLRFLRFPRTLPRENQSRERERIYRPTNLIHRECCYVFVKLSDIERWMVRTTRQSPSHKVLFNFAADRHCQQSAPTFQRHANILFANLIKPTRHPDSQYALAILFIVSFVISGVATRNANAVHQRVALSADWIYIYCRVFVESNWKSLNNLPARWNFSI